MNDVALLPVNSTAFEKAFVDTTGRITGIPVPLRELWRPEEMPAALIPWLAWGLSVDVWDENWPVERKRAVVLASFQMHQKKGTQGGIRAYVETLDADLIRSFVPPGKTYLSPAHPREEREAALADLPQIRLYDWEEEGLAGNGIYLNDFAGKFTTDDSGDPLLFPIPSTANSRLKGRATYWDRGVGTDITRATFTDEKGGVIERVALPPVVKQSTMFCGQGIGAGWSFTMPSDAYKRLVTFNITEIAPSERVLQLFPIVPSLTPINTAPDRVAEFGTNAVSVFAGARVRVHDTFGGDGMSGHYLMPSTAGQRLFEVIYLRDVDRPMFGRQALSYCGDGRLGVPRFTAELDITVLSTLPVRAAGEFVYGFFVAGDRTRLTRVLDAVVRAKSRRDKVLVNPTTFRPVAMGKTLLLGSPIILGQWAQS